MMTSRSSFQKKTFLAASPALAFVGMSLLVACPSGSQEERAGKATPSVEGRGGTEKGAALPDGTQGTEGSEGRQGSTESPIDPAQLHPSIQLVGDEGAVPSRITIEFTQPIVAGADAVLKSTRVRVEPDVEGTMRFAGPATLEFTPKAPFENGKRYRFVLEAVDTRSGVVEASGSDWELTFDTPRFALLRANLFKVESKKKRLELDLVYSGPVDERTIPKKGRFTINGLPAGKVTYERTERSNVVRATLTDSKIADGVRVRFDQDPGVLAKGDAEQAAPLGSAELTLPEGKPIEILASWVEEGGSGFYIQVVCRDAAVGENSLYYWNSKTHDSYEVSQRCVLDESDAKESLHLKPAVKWSITPTRGGFRILGDFKRGSYTLRIDPDARSIDGGSLARSYEASFSVPARSPSLGFMAQGRYLPRSAWKTLAIRHRNVSEAELRVRHIPADNLAFWMSDESERANERNSTLVVSQKIPLKSVPDELVTSSIEVAHLVPKIGRGLLELQLTSGGAVATARLLATDLNVIAKRQGDSGDVYVWVLDIHTNRPVVTAEAKQIVKSGRVVSRCLTDGSGGCLLKGVDKNEVDQSEPFAILVSSGEDLTYLSYEDLKTKVDDASVFGLPYSDPNRTYQAAIYSDRGVYRPGDIVHLAAILRDKDASAPPHGMPVDIELVDPRGNVARKLSLSTNEAGMIAFDQRFEAYADTGRYHVRASAGIRSVGEYGFSVEEFVPERMRVSAAVQNKALLASDTAEVEVAAEYLFGGSAEGSTIELSCRLEAMEFQPENNADYEYGVWREAAPTPIPLGAANSTINAEGKARISCPPLSGRGTLGSTARLIADVAVFEGGSGRTTRQSASAIVHPSKIYIGLKSSVETVKVGDDFTVSGVLVDWKGTALNEAKKLEVELFRVEREQDWAYDQNRGEWTYRRLSRLTSEGSQSVTTAAGRFQLRLKVGSGASEFVVRAKLGRDTETETDLVLSGDPAYDAWWYGEYGEDDRRDKTPRPAQASSIAIEVPQEIEVHDVVTLRFVAPFAGRALVSVETDAVIKKEWLDVKPGPVSWPFALEHFAPNVYVSVLVVKDPHADSPEAFVPSRAFGVRSVRVVPQAYLQPLEISVPSEVRSNSKLEVKLSFGGPVKEPMFVTVAAVDEGILSLTQFATPDPLSAIFSKRALGVTTFETIGWNVLLPASGQGGTAGGDAAGSLGRAQPVKPVALWSGVLRVPEDGKLTTTLEVPEYRGALRVMAVAASPKKMASASKQVVVRDPIVVDATLPRFATFGDVMRVPVFVTNLSGKKRTIDVHLSAAPLDMGDGANNAGKANKASENQVLFQFVEGERRTLELDDTKSGVALFELKAERAVGAAKLTVKAASGEVVIERNIEMPFAPAAPKTRRVERIELTSERTDLKPLLRGWLPTTERSSFWVTSNPYGDTFDHLKYLIHYPYGCIEQTTSAARPLLFVGRFVERVDARGVNVDLDVMVMAGVTRILSMQASEGGFVYWPGGSDVAYWASAYATHFLLDAKKLNYPVQQARLDDALSWMERVLNDEPSFGNRHWDQWDYRNARPYLHYVLALAGRGRKAAMQKLLGELEQQGKRTSEMLEQIYMLKAGLHLMGDRSHERDLRNPDLSAISETRENSWTFYSDRRRRGFVLSTFVDLFGADKAAEPLANLVAEALRARASHGYTTQELVWGVTGLGKFVGQNTANIADAELFIDGKKRAPKEAPAGSSDKAWSVYRASEYNSVEVEFRAKKAEEKAFLILASEGVEENGKWQVGGNGLSITREHRSASGEPVRLDEGGVKLGDVVYVVLEVTNKTGERMQNIALVDRFPAGWEIENPRLGRGSNINWIKPDELWTPDYLNLRDDRVEVFGTIERNETKKFVYAVRAVTAGIFAMPPAEAEAMYDPTRWARVSGGRVIVHGPWK